MKIDLQPYFESGTIEIEKAKEIFHKYNKDNLFDSFVTGDPNEKIAIGKPDNTKIRFSYEDKKEFFWLVVELVPNTESNAENDEIMELIDIDYFDPNRDYRNG